MSHRNRITRRSNRLRFEQLENRENPNGTVTAALTAGGVLSLRGDALDNDIRLETTGSGAVVTGLNGTQIKFNGAVSGSATISGSVKHIKTVLYAGNDRVAINGSTAFGIAGNALFDLGAGNNTLDLATSAALNIGGHLNVRAAAGTDSIVVRGGLASNSAVSGNVGVALGAGGSTVSIQDLTVHGAAGVSVSAGVGDDNVTLNGTVMSRGGAKISAGHGQLDVDLTGAINVAGRVGIFGAAGVDVDVAGGNFGAISARGGASLSTNTNVNIAGSTSIDTDLRVRGANAMLDADAALSVGRHTVVAGSNATLDASGATLTLGKNLFVSASRKATVNLATSGNADIAGNLYVIGGIDGDSIDANSNLSVGGSARLSLRGGNNHVSLGTSGDLDLNGSLVVLTGSGNDDVTLTQVQIDGRSIIRLGAGADSLNVHNGTIVSGSAFIDLGAGADVLAVANNFTATAGATFNGRAVIVAGAGDDNLSLGLAGGLFSAVRFNAPANLLIGGAGTDLFVQANAQIIGALGIVGVP